MTRKNTLPVHLPAALPMPFSAPGRADALLPKVHIARFKATDDGRASAFCESRC